MAEKIDIVDVQQQAVVRDKSKVEKRIHEIDSIRGFCMLLVFMDHFFWNLTYFGSIWKNSSTPGVASFFNQAYQNAEFYWYSPHRMLVRVLVLAIFIFVSGISTSFSKNNYKRAAQMLAFYFIIQIGTNLVSPYWTEAFGINSQVIINFNVIGVVAWSVLFYSFVNEKSWRVLAVIVLTLGLFYIVFLPRIYEDIATNHSGDLYYMNVWPLWQSSRTAEADYMPLFPFIVIFFIGALFSRFAYAERKSHFGKMQIWEKPICFIGRHSLIFYLSHQLIFVGLFSLVGLLTGWGI